MKLSYPPAHLSDLVETLHEVEIPDPYRWMEDIDSAEVRAWVEEQNQLTQNYLATLPNREAIKNRMTELWNYEKFGVPSKHAARYFYSYNDGLANQDRLYWQESLESQPVCLLDPNELSEDGTIALSGGAVSNNGRYLAYGLSEAGSDWQEWYVREVDSGKDLTDHIRWVKFSGASWDKEDQGFYYSRYAQPSEEERLSKANYDQKLYYHKLGTSQEEDELVYERPDHKEWGFYGQVTEDGHYLVITVSVGTQDEVAIFYKDLSNPESQVIELLPNFDAEYLFVGNEESRLYFLTTNTASKRRVIAIEINNPHPEDWQEIIPQSEHTLESASLVGDRFICCYLVDAVNAVKMFDLQGKFLADVYLPGLGTVIGFEGEKSQTETFFNYTDITTPPCVYRFDVLGNEVTLLKQPVLKFDPGVYTTKQVFITSRDGTQVPMFLSFKKDLEINGDAPTYLFGYGGFNISIPVMFKVPNLLWMELGGIYAQVQLRGGGEYGEAWHQAGMKANKQNVFDDFIAAAEWLILEGYTNTKKLAIGGRSNGGLLIGAVMTQRPDLFGVCMPTVGVLDMLRFHKFTIGWAWVSDYGSPDDPEDFKYLLAYSPYHNIKLGTSYPPTMITTGDHDDRVFPAHSYKFAAAMQAAQAGSAPILIRIDTRAGHGVGKPTAKLIEEFADLWAFTLAHLE